MTYAPAGRTLTAGRPARSGRFKRMRYADTAQCRGTKMRYQYALMRNDRSLPRSGCRGSRGLNRRAAREGFPGCLRTAITQQELRKPLLVVGRQRATQHMHPGDRPGRRTQRATQAHGSGDHPSSIPVGKPLPADDPGTPSWRS